MKLSNIALSIISFCSAILAQDKVVVGYYVPWGKVEPEALSYDKVTHINYGFGVLTKKNNPTSIFFDRYYDGNRLRKLKKLAAAKGVKVLISLGGWTGSQTFSTVAADPALRAKFINNALVFVRKNTLPEYAENPDGWELDGIDLDWEYPGRGAAICNVVSPNDSANYLALLKELRAALDKEFPNEHKLITAAVRVQPFDGADGKPLKDVSAYAQYFDFINLMAYDIMGSWSATTGPNAPHNYDTARGGDPYSFTQGVNDWLAAGFPASKLTGGLAFYGRTLSPSIDMDLDPTNQYVKKEPVTPKGDSSDSNEANFFCNEGSVYSGVYKYKYLRSDILTGGPTSASNGFNRYWDNTTQTPWLFSKSAKKFISYDDPQSLKIKVDFAKSKDLRGVMYWDMAQDHNDELLNVAQAIRNGGTNPTPTTTTTTTSTTTTTTTTPTTTTTTTPTTTSTTSTSTTSTTTPIPTGSCTEGSIQCVTPGKSAQYQQCIFGKWSVYSCGSGTVCKTSGNSIVCDFP